MKELLELSENEKKAILCAVLMQRSADSILSVLTDEEKATARNAAKKAAEDISETREGRRDERRGREVDPKHAKRVERFYKEFLKLSENCKMQLRMSEIDAIVKRPGYTDKYGIVFTAYGYGFTIGYKHAKKN